MTDHDICPACGAAWPEGETCQSYFHQMLFWESEDPTRGVVHHLLVLCYHLQHPYLYSPEGLRWAMQGLVDFVENGVTPEQVRERERKALGADTRTWKVSSRVGEEGSYPVHINWTMTAADVVERGAENYVQSVRDWAANTLSDLRAVGVLRTA